MGDDNEKKLLVSYDRSAVTLRLFAKDAFDIYKESRQSQKDFYSCDYIDFPTGTVTPDGYYCSLSGKLSLKEFIGGEETVSIKLFLRLLETISKVAKRTTAFGVDMGDIIFDYASVFLVGERFVLIYMPGASGAFKKQTAADLVNVVFLNLEMTELSQDMYEVLENFTAELSVEKKPKNMAELIDNVILTIREELEKNASWAAKFKRKFGQKDGKKQENNAPEEEKKVQSKKIIAFFPNFKGEEDKYEKIFALGKETRINVGRDENWADINPGNAFVSRRHAQIVIEKDGEVKIEDLSLNGTAAYNDCDEKMHVVIGDGYEIVLSFEDAA